MPVCVITRLVEVSVLLFATRTRREAHTVALRAADLGLQVGVVLLERLVRPQEVSAVLELVGRLDLSLRRAESLAAALKSRGVRNPIEVEAFGEGAPKQSNADARGRRANRRVEVYFLFSGQT